MRCQIRKTVVAFRLYGPKTGRLWLVLERTGVSICHADPGLDPASYVHVDGQVAALYRVYMGRCALNEEISAGQLTLSGTPTLIHGLPHLVHLEQLLIHRQSRHPGSRITVALTIQNGSQMY